MTAHADSAAPIETVLPLTPLQTGMLFHCLAAREDDLYVTQVAIQLRGTLDESCWRSAWHQVSQRHQALRSAFFWEDRQQPLQVVLHEPCFVFTAEDWRRDQIDAARLGSRMLVARKEPLSLKTGELMKHLLIRTDESAYVHIWTFHHILLDGWSSQIVIREALKLYAGAVDKEEQILPPPPSLNEYLAWAASRDTAEAERYWRSSLSRWPGATTLGETSGGRLDTVQNAKSQRVLDSSCTERLRVSCRASGLTLHSAVLGTFVAVLARLTGQADVVVGTVHSGRDGRYPGTETLVGLLMNTVPVRLAVDSDAVAVDWLRRVQSEYNTAVEHGHLPLADLKRFAAIRADESIFECMLVFEDVPVMKSDPGALVQIEHVDYFDRTNIPLAVLVNPGKRLTVAARYDSHYCDERLVNELLDGVQHCLAMFGDRPAARLSAWAPVIAEPDAAVIAADGPCSTSLAAQSTVIERIWAQAARTPDAPALRCGTDTRSYSALVDQVEQLAAGLCELGVPPCAVVGLAPGSGLDTITVMLAAQRAGAAYAVLEPACPQARAEQMLGDLATTWPDKSQVLVVLTSAGSVALPDTVRTATIRELLDAGTARESLHGRHAQADGLAYVLFTSGSTGRPKGVPVRHRNLSYSTHCRCMIYAHSPRRFLLLSPLFFDSSVAGLFWTLTTGGELVVPDKAVDRHAGEIPQWIEANAITHLLCLPSLYSLILSTAGAQQLSSLRSVIVAGESCPAEVVFRHRRADLEATLHNEYGPTETTVWCTAYDLGADLVREPVPVGAAIPGTRIELFDEAGRVVPSGCPGEIWVTGPGVVDGYLNDDASTAKRFIRTEPDPSGQYYRTGDLARVDKNGDLLFLGRIDSQVKLRGRRIEPGEVESMLLNYPGIHEAVVAGVSARGDGAITGLGALVVESRTVDRVALGNYLRETLPGGLVPQVMERVDQLPRLPNGKLDRRAAAQRFAKRSVARSPSGTLVGALQHLIAEQWREALKLQSIGPDDDFFDLGGDSLTAALVIQKINRHANLQLGIAHLYAGPTVAALARCAGNPSEPNDWVRTVAIRAEGSRPPLFFAYGNAHQVAARLGPEQPVHWLIEGRGGTVVPTDDFAVLAAQHLEQLRNLQPRGPYRLAGFSLGALVALEVARLLHETGQQPELVMLIDPTRASLFRVRSRPGRLLSMLRRSGSALERSRYLFEFTCRLPEFVRDKLSRGAAPKPVEPDPLLGLAATPSTQTNGSEMSHGEILAAVRLRLDRYRPAPYPGHLHLVRIDRGEPRTLEAMDEETFWHEIAGDGLTLATVRSKLGHRNLFRDPEALDGVCGLLDTMLTETHRGPPWGTC